MTTKLEEINIYCKLALETANVMATEPNNTANQVNILTHFIKQIQKQCQEPEAVEISRHNETGHNARCSCWQCSR